MRHLNVAEAKAQFTKALSLLSEGIEQEIVIAKNNQPIAKIVPVTESVVDRFGTGKDLFSHNENFDELIPQARNWHPISDVAIFGDYDNAINF